VDVARIQANEGVMFILNRFIQVGVLSLGEV